MKARLTHRIHDGEDIDHEDHDPPPGTGVAVDALRSIQHPHNSHTREEDEATVDGGGSATPAVDEDYGEDREGEDADR